MIKLTSSRWAIIFFISLALNLFLGGLFVADKYLKGQGIRGFRGMVYSVPWARRILGDEVRPLEQQVFRDYRKQFIDTRRDRADLFRNVTAALVHEPFDKNALRGTLTALQENIQIDMAAMHNMIAEFSSQITPDQRKKLAREATRIQEKRFKRRERRRKRREKREQNK